jgi:hypothetical protein
MADTKISALTAASTPLAGSEVLPIVQSGTTVKVSVDNLTTGKDVTVKGLTATSTTDNSATVRTTGTSGGASVIIRAGDGTTSSLYSYARFVNDNTAGQDWRLGIYGDSDVQLVNVTGSKNLMRWSTGGDVTVPAGNLVIGTAGKGIDFSATPGTGTSELLADYEEGTWTPVVTATSGSITTVGGSTAGTYTKTGRVVTLLFQIQVVTNGTGAGAIQVGGIPFSENPALAGYAGGGANGNTGKSVSCTLQGGFVYIYLYDGTYPIASGEILYCTLTYQA